MGSLKEPFTGDQNSETKGLKTKARVKVGTKWGECLKEFLVQREQRGLTSVYYLLFGLR